MGMSHLSKGSYSVILCFLYLRSNYILTILKSKVYCIIYRGPLSKQKDNIPDLSPNIDQLKNERYILLLHCTKCIAVHCSELKYLCIIVSFVVLCHKNISMVVPKTIH